MSTSMKFALAAAAILCCTFYVQLDRGERAPATLGGYRHDIAPQRTTRAAYGTEGLPVPYTETAKLSDGTEVALSGTQKYILKFGKVVSEGYHEITPFENGYLGQQGALKYLLDKEGKKVSPGFHRITPTSAGYEAKVGALYFRLDKSGRLIEPSEIPTSVP